MQCRRHFFVMSRTLNTQHRLRARRKRVASMATSLLISNVSSNCPEEILKEWIEERGFNVVGLRLVRDLVSGTSLSFAHVRLSAAGELEQAQQALDGQTLDGLALRVRCMARMRALSASVEN